ncbi:hypothetical protein [Halobacillus litoralis]|uniref:hypothetical protein n=1 Tax=Halobacillus litoralis TaxID=45668 RepID=UPI001CD4B730|nr:hypothetical protein [Halobacillus litoralis]MCA1021511.1 hypothetical protein [Halobacillus litoralis]
MNRLKTQKYLESKNFSNIVFEKSLDGFYMFKAFDNDVGMPAQLEFDTNEEKVYVSVRHSDFYDEMDLVEKNVLFDE